MMHLEADATLHVVVGELIPKSFAIFATEKYALHTAGPLRVFYRITYPIMVIFNGITNGVMRLFGHDPADEHEVYTGEEIKLLIDESTESGLIDPEQNEFVDNIFDLGDKDAEGIMTPRTDVICLDLEDTLEENWDVVRQYKYTRYPVCDGSKDRIVGFVHTKDLVDEPKDAPMSDWKIRELPPVPEGAPIAKLLQAMQEYAAQLAAQRTSYSGSTGGGSTPSGAASSGAGTSGTGGAYENNSNASGAYNGTFIWPVDSTYITSRYGERSAPTAGASTNHKAIDIGAKSGDPIYAAADGQVASATYNNGLGYYVSIEHDGETATRYSHMTNFIVQPGEHVKQGQIIGYVGESGIATGSHLDYAVIKNGQQVDPMQYYDESTVTYDPTA